MRKTKSPEPEASTPRAHGNIADAGMERLRTVEARLLNLQRTIGNRALQRAMLQREVIGAPPALQRNLLVYYEAYEPPDATTGALFVAGFRTWLAGNDDTLTGPMDALLAAMNFTVVTTATVRARFYTWAVANDPQDAETIVQYARRFRDALIPSNELLTGPAAQAIRDGVGILTTATVVPAFNAWTGDAANLPRDAETAAGYVDRFRRGRLTADQLLSAQARQALVAGMQLVVSAAAPGLFAQWLAAAPANQRQGGETFHAHLMRFRHAAYQSAPARILTREAVEALIIADLGANISGAMAAANQASTQPNPLVAYPAVPFDAGGGGGPQVLGHPGQGHLPPLYWQPMPSAGWSFALRPGVLPSEAVTAALRGPSRLECLSLTTGVLAKGLLDTLGPQRFDQLFAYRSPIDPGVVIGTNVEPTHSRIAALRQNPNVNTVAQLIPGDWIYYQNDLKYRAKHPAGLWQGENLVYDGNNLFSGFGLQGMTIAQLRANMEHQYRLPPTPRDIAHPDYRPAIWQAEQHLPAAAIPVNVVGLRFDTLQRFRPDWIRELMQL